MGKGPGNGKETGHRILCIDDEGDFLDLLVRVLREGGYRAEGELDPKKGLEKALKKSYDLILLDIMMPEMDGYEVCRALKASDETFAVPVLFLTAKGGASDILHGFYTGAHDYACKPLDRKEILSKVERLLG